MSSDFRGDPNGQSNSHEARCLRCGTVRSPDAAEDALCVACASVKAVFEGSREEWEALRAGERKPRPCPVPEDIEHDAPPPSLTTAQEQPRQEEQPRPLFAAECAELSKELAAIQARAEQRCLEMVERTAQEMLAQGHTGGVLTAADFVESGASRLDSEASGLTRDVLFAIAAQLRASVGAKGVVRS